MNQLETNKIKERIRFWDGERKEQLQLKKGVRNQDKLHEAERRISFLKSWLNGTDVEESVEVAEERAAQPTMSMEEFKAMANKILGATAEPGAVMIIHDRKMLDAVYEKIKLTNIQIQAPKHVIQYYKQKLQKERPYKQ